MVGQPFVVDVQQVQDRGVQMANRNTVFDGLVAKPIGRPIVESSLDSPPDIQVVKACGL